MNTLFRYILKEFWKPLVFTCICFVGIYTIAELVDEMPGFVSHHAPVILILLYYIYRIPYFLIQTLPLSILLSTLFSLGQLARNNELIAMRSCGISFYRITAPILLTAALAVAGVLVFNELVIPFTNPRAHHIKTVNIEGKVDQSFQFQRDWVTRSVSGNRILHIRHLDALEGRMSDVILLEVGPRMTVTRRLDAPLAHWTGRQWIFENGVLRDFGADGSVTAFQKFNQIGISFKELPQDFIRQEKDADQMLSMTLKELRYQIQLLRETGSDPRKEEVNFHLKIAFPFANLILAILGVSLPFIFPTGRRAVIWAAIGFVITIITGFFYIGFIAVGTSFGKNGMLPPLLSVWIANILFAILGMVFISRAKS
jgi:lipopolysaccharide export system permease protein